MDIRDINLLRKRKFRSWQSSWQNKNVQLVPEKIKAKNRLRQKIYLIGGLIFIIIVIIIFGFKYYTIARWPQDPSAYDHITLKPKNSFLQTVKNIIFEPKNVLDGQTDDRVNILLLGMGGAGHQGAYLSDTNIIFTLKPSTNELAMISIPRDMSAKIDGYGWRKINNANALGETKKPDNGGEFARNVFAKNLGIDIQYYIRVDFQAFKDIVDAVGGLEIEVLRSFVDYSYPGPNYSYKTVRFDKGAELMGGERALIYTRSRHGNNGEGSDFARARRQQVIIAALKEKMLSAGTYLNPIKIQKTIEALTNHLTTNLDFGQIMYLAGLARKIDQQKIKTMVLDNSPGGYLTQVYSVDGAYLLAPRDGNFTEITNAINNIFNTTSTLSGASALNASASRPKEYIFPTAKIEIQNGTWQVGLAAKARQKLEEKGFYVNSIGNSALRPIAASAIYIINTSTKQELIKALVKEIKITATSAMPYWLNENTTTSVSSTTDPIVTVVSTSPDVSANPASALPLSNMTKYNKNTDILIIIGEDYSTF